MGFLPVTKSEINGQPDFIMISADAYVDHPSFGHAVIARVLESKGYSVAIIPQPNIKSDEDFMRFGKPRLGFLVSTGNIDSMVNHYSVSLHRRKEDLYSPGGKSGLRPDRPGIVYTRILKRLYPDVPVIMGGIEASLRRFAHYDYWDNEVKPSIIYESGADVVIYGMGERAAVQIADNLENGINSFTDGCCYYTEDLSSVAECEILPSYEMTKEYKSQYNIAFKMQYEQQNSPKSPVMVQPHGIGYVVQMPPQKPLSEQEMDEIYSLPYMRKPHPMYKDGVPAIKEVEFSITAHRGCYGGCAFCALVFHQGRIIQSRSYESIVGEAEQMAKSPDFKGYIHDVGGPTANFHTPACKRQEFGDVCKHRQCMFPEPCKSLKADHSKWMRVLEGVESVKGVKKAFVRSGLRFDYLLLDKDKTVLDRLVKNNISGQLKIAPEHVSDNVLCAMGKPPHRQFTVFCREYEESNKRMGKNQYMVPYFMSSHPGCTLRDAVELAVYLKEKGIKPQQVQDFYPTPGTLSTCIYYTGVNPITGEKTYVARDKEDKAMQRALMQFFLPQNKKLVIKALTLCKRTDLIGYDEHCLVRPDKEYIQEKAKNKHKDRAKQKMKKR